MQDNCKHKTGATVITDGEAKFMCVACKEPITNVKVGRVTEPVDRDLDKYSKRYSK